MDYCFKTISCCGCPNMDTCTMQKLNDEIIEKELDSIFRRYGSPSKDCELTVREYLIKPQKINELDRLSMYDKSAKETIQQMETYIKKLKIYRAALQKRYQYIAIAPTAPVIKLTRRKDAWKNKVFYFLSVYDRNLLDNSEVMRENQKYEGKERHIAIADFKKYIASHPGIISEVDANIKI